MKEKKQPAEVEKVLDIEVQIEGVNPIPEQSDAENQNEPDGQSEAKERATERIIVFRVNRPLTQKDHEQLSEKIRFEQEKSGVRIVLMPYSCELDGEA